MLQKRDAIELVNMFIQQYKHKNPEHVYLGKTYKLSWLDDALNKYSLYITTYIVDTIYTYLDSIELRLDYDNMTIKPIVFEFKEKDYYNLNNFELVALINSNLKKLEKTCN